MQKTKVFHNLETIGGILLFSSAILAILLSNTAGYHIYREFLSTKVAFIFGSFSIDKPLLLWINDGLMSVYFFLVGLEIKREIKRGVLSNLTSIIVPLVTAVFGLIIPALIFIILNQNETINLSGWAIPTATDIAFTLGILALLGSRIPLSLKVLLTSIAIFDDIAAIIIIAIFYTDSLSYLSLSCAIAAILILLSLNLLKCRKVSVYIFVGICLWVAVLKSGVHATLAGIVLAMAIPDEEQDSSLSKLISHLHPWIVFAILPLFAFANAGVSLTGIGFEQLSNTLFLGITLGLFIGKQIGIFIPLWFFVKFKHFLAFDNITLRHIYGIAVLCGVGFTMSLFIGTLAFKANQAHLLPLVRMGVLSGSLISGVLGYIILYSRPKPDRYSNSEL